MAKRTIATIKQFDYTSEDAFKKDIPVMKKKGYILLDTTGLQHAHIHGSEDSEWKYTAYFIKDSLS